MSSRLCSFRIPVAIFLCTGLGAGTTSLASQSSDQRALELSRRMDDLYRADSSRSEIEMVITTPQYERTLVATIASKGTDKTLIRILAPRKEQGNATLKRGRDIWNYLPKIDKTIRIPPAMMTGSWMGTDFSNDDLVREVRWETDYTITFLENPKDGQECLKYVPKENIPVTWSRVEVCIDKETLLPVQQSFFDEKGRLSRVMEFSEVKEIGGRKVPMKMTLLPMTDDKKGHRTSIEYKKIEFNVDIPDSTFTLAALRREN